MSTSRAILPRASRSSNGRRTRPIAVLALALWTIPHAGAQDAASALLLSQPRYTSSISILPANALAGFETEYRTESGDYTVIVGERDLTTPQAIACELQPTFRLDGRRSIEIVRYDADAYSVYVAAARLSEARACEFLRAFTDRFAFFYAVDRRTRDAIATLSRVKETEPSGLIPRFPAVLELSSTTR
jgi:hypothetical protein